MAPLRPDFKKNGSTEEEERTKRIILQMREKFGMEYTHKTKYVHE